MLLFLTAGALAFPYLKEFYTRNPVIAVPSFGVLAVTEFTRGVVHAVALLPFLRTMNGRTVAASLLAGFALAILGGISSLLLPIDEILRPRSGAFTSSKSLARISYSASLPHTCCCIAEREMLPQLLANLPDMPPKDRLSPRCSSYLRERGLSNGFIATLDECAYAGDIQLGKLWLSVLGEVDHDNQLEENRPCIEHGFLIVGSGLNGDLIALHIPSGKMAFISHDLLWEEDYQDFAECVVQSPLGFEEFWIAAVEDRKFPVDSDDARERWPSE